MAKPPKPPAEAELAPEWEGIETAPKSLKPIDVSEDGERWVAAYWRETSRMNFKKRHWERIGFWARFGSQNDRLDFEPLVWRPLVFR